MKHILILGLLLVFAATAALTYISDVGTYAYYTTTGDKNVTTRGAEVVRLVNAAGTAVTVTLWDTASGACSGGTQMTGTITLTNGSPITLGLQAKNGICVTVGGTGPTVTVVYR